MDAVLLARFQFAMTIGFHYIFPPLSIGLSWLVVLILTLYLRTGDALYRDMARFWIRIKALVFVAGVATGITMEFQFGTNWAAYSRFVGDIFGAPLAAEGVFAFFLESTFLGLLLFGEKRLSKRMYWFSALMVAVGTIISAFWIIVANSWQQTPAGFRLLEGKVELINFWAAVFNPSTLPRFSHTIVAALMTGAFFMLGISAYYLLKKRHLPFTKKSLTLSLWVALITSILQIPTGHFHAIQVAETQPIKFAAFEGLFETEENTPFILFGFPNPEKERTDYAIKLPGVVKMLAGQPDTSPILGLKAFPRDEWPPIRTTFYSFHFMVMIGMYLLGLCFFGLFLHFRKQLFDETNRLTRLFLKLALFSIPLPFIGNQLGWIAAEVGRQPWIVYKLLRTHEGVSLVVSAGEILTSIIIFAVLYAFMFVVWIYLLNKKIQIGPQEATT